MFAASARSMLENVRTEMAGSNRICEHAQVSDPPTTVTYRQTRIPNRELLRPAIALSSSSPPLLWFATWLQSRAHAGGFHRAVIPTIPPVCLL